MSTSHVRWYYTTTSAPYDLSFHGIWITKKEDGEEASGTETWMLSMISGHIATISSQQNTFSGFRQDNSNPNLEACVDLTDTFQTNGGTSGKGGLAMEERYVDTETIQVNGGISIQVSQEKKQYLTQCWLADYEYVVVQNKQGRFGFDLLERLIGGSVDPVTFDIGRIIDDHPGQWMGRFGDRSSNVNSGTLYGDDIEYDAELGQAYSNSNKSEIGVRMRYDTDAVMVRVGESWFQILSPNYTREQYISFFEDAMRTYVM